MIYKIFEQDAETLLEKPETGMGYQIVNAAQYDRNQIKKFIIYNTNLAIELDADFLIYKRQIINEGYKAVLGRATQLMLETETIKVFPNSPNREFKMLSESNIIRKKRYSGGRSAKDSPTRNATGDEIFVRVSAYEDDKRIDFVNMKLKNGSYTTTLQDYIDCCTTNDNPVDRYALPNDEKINFAFFIKPKSIDTLQQGIVQPDFGHEGGGIEAFFTNGTSNGTYLFQKDYGQ